MKMKHKFTKLRINVDKRFVSIIVLVLIFAAIFISSIVFRAYFFGNNSLPGKEANFNINIAKDILSFKNDFVLQKLAVRELVWPLTIALVSFITRLSPELSMIILSFLFGVFSVVLIYLIIEKMDFKKRNLALAFFLISPVTIWLFSTFNRFILPFFFALLALYFLLLEKKNLSLLALAFTSLFGIVSSVSALTILILGFKKGFWKWFWKAILISFFINILLFFLFPFLGVFKFNFNNLFSLFFSLSEFGISIFTFLLACIGIFITWKGRKERKELFLVYITFTLLFIFSITNKAFIFFFNFILVLLAAIGFTKLLERDWASQFIKKLTIGILVIGIILPLVFMPLRIASLTPNTNLVNALEFLKGEEDGKVLSIKDNGYWIKGFSGKEAFVDDFKAQVKPELEEKALEFLNERNLKKMNEEFKSKNIKYFLLDKQTRKLFRTEDEGILLLLHTSAFNKIYDKEGIEIWEFLE